MRGLLIDYVRRRQAVKGGGEFQLTTARQGAAAYRAVSLRSRSIR